MNPYRDNLPPENRIKILSIKDKSILIKKLEESIGDIKNENNSKTKE